MNITDFRERCLSILEDVPAEGLVITKRGVAIATIMPVIVEGSSLSWRHEGKTRNYGGCLLDRRGLGC